MDIRALRYDLAQKSAEAKKTNFSEDKINTTFSGIYDDAQTDKYCQLAETLEIELYDLVEAIKQTQIRLGSAKDREKIKKAAEDKKKKEEKKEAVVAEGVMSKALRVGHKYPELVKKAVTLQTIKADEAETARDYHHKQSEKLDRSAKKLGHELAKNKGEFTADPQSITTDFLQWLDSMSNADSMQMQMAATSHRMKRDEAAAKDKAHSKNIKTIVDKAVKRSRKK